MPSLREWTRYRRERRANRRALKTERGPGEGQEIGYMAVGKRNNSNTGTSGTGGV
jgi:hypothetical protein